MTDMSIDDGDSNDGENVFDNEDDDALFNLNLKGKKKAVPEERNDSNNTDDKGNNTTTKGKGSTKVKGEECEGTTES